MARNRDDDDDDIDVGKKPLSGLDGMFANTNMAILIIFGCCCGGIAAILGLVGVLTCTDPKAKSNATIVMIIGAVSMVLGIVSQFMIPRN